ncbi:MAG TPA: hypothetical protein DDW52_28115 [Planctomycetaceae bacterium]|nr:hypothetical protein [Planctomycetaceae bacterium]
MNTRKPHIRCGITLLEMLAVVTIIGVVAAVALPRISISGVAAKKEMCGQHVAEVNRALERYYANSGERLIDTAKLNDADYFPHGVPRCPLTGEAYQIDESTKRLKACSCSSK